jgi:nicotinamidase-related amidase
MVIDVQKGPVAHAHQRDAVVANISALVDKARDEGCRSSGSSTSTRSWRRAVMPGSTSRSRHATSQNRWCTKSFGDSSEDSDLDQVLAEAGVGRLLVTGASRTDASGAPSTALSPAATT